MPEKTLETRTAKSIHNARVTLIYFFLQLILSFFSRKAFFDYLGTEILGLNTTAGNLLGFLNLAELGISMSVGFFLYKPLFNSDEESIKEIISIQGWLYRKIAYVILGGSAIIMLFFPLIFAKSDLPVSYAYASYSVLLFSSMLGYFFNYRQILLVADQKNYKVQRITQGATMLKIIIQILAVKYSSHPFLYWLILEALFAIIGAYILDRILHREYPWLQTDVSKGKEYSRVRPEILNKTKQIFVHKLSEVVLKQSSSMIIYGFTSLTMVALYGNYTMIVEKVSHLISGVFSSTEAGVGNLVASKDRERIISVFWELNDSKFCIAAIFMTTLFFIVNPFIGVWLGHEYILGGKLLLLILLYNSIMIVRSTVDSYINAYGLFQDVWAPITEAIINVFFSVLLGYFLGIEGIVIGTTLSLIIIIVLWKPYFLFTKGLGIPPKQYFIPFSGRIALVAVGFCICLLICNYIKMSISTYMELFVYSSVVSAVCFIVYVGIFTVCTKGMRNFNKRILRKICGK